MKKHRWFAVISAMVMVLAAFGCKTDTETEWKDKTYCSAVTFTSEATADGVKVTMATTTEGAVIYYTTDGTLPTEKSIKYSEAVEFTKDATVKAIAIKEGIENSPVSIATVSIKEKTITETKIEYVDKTYCSAVTFTSEATADGVKVTMATTTEGAVIYYTTDGTLPTKESTKYSEAVEFRQDATVKAIAIKEGIENSPVSIATVSIKEKTITETKIEYVDKKADETAPASVTELTAQAQDSRILLTWKDAADSDIYGYEVSYSGTKPINRVVLPALDTTSMMVPPKAGGTYVNGLTNGTEYTFTVKTVDTSGNKSEGVTVKGIPVEGETLTIALTASVPQENGYTGNKSNTKVTVTANITTASKVKKVVWKKDGSLIAKTLLADKTAAAATETEDNAVWTFDITAQEESANGSYTVAAIDEAGREEAEQITIDNFDFTPPAKVKVTNAVYSSENSSIAIEWTEPGDADYHHVDITFTTNDGTNNSEPSQAITVNKGTLNKTFSDIEGEKAYYTYTFVTYDELGNKGAEYIHKVPVNSSLKVDYSDCVVGDFILKDGTILSKDETPESDTVAAVIVRAATNDKPALGVGIVHNRSGLAWCTTSAAGYNTNITALQGDKTSGYMDGSDGWEILKEACSDAENNPEKYPAWNYSLTYAETNGLTGDLATGWYLPTVAELYTIYQNKTAVDASLSKAGGSQFGTSWYWSCCQNPSDDGYARGLIFYYGGMYDYAKDVDSNYVCSVRAFN